MTYSASATEMIGFFREHRRLVVTKAMAVEELDLIGDKCQITIN